MNFWIFEFKNSIWNLTINQLIKISKIQYSIIKNNNKFKIIQIKWCLLLDFIVYKTTTNANNFREMVQNH